MQTKSRATKLDTKLDDHTCPAVTGGPAVCDCQQPTELTTLTTLEQQLIETLKQMTATLKTMQDALMLMAHPVYVVPTQPSAPYTPYIGDAPIFCSCGHMKSRHGRFGCEEHDTQSSRILCPCAAFSTR
jgi:hypothetical protein